MNIFHLDLPPPTIPPTSTPPQTTTPTMPSTIPPSREISSPSHWGLRCGRCGGMEFQTVQEQRQHFQSPQHIQRLSSVSREPPPPPSYDSEEYSEVDSDISSSGGSGSESELSGQSPIMGDSVVVFGYSIYRAVLLPNPFSTNTNTSTTATTPTTITLMEESLRQLQQRQESHPYWTILLLSGGRFAGCIFRNHDSSLIHHRTFHRYTVRRKQGGSQRTRDNKQVGRQPQSIGASIRRQNETLLQEQLLQLLGGPWRQDIAERSSRVFVYAPGQYNRQLLVRACGMHKDLVRSVPIRVHAITHKEVLRIYAELSSVVPISRVE